MPIDLIQRLTLQGGVIPGAVSLLLLGVFWWMYQRQSALPRDEEGDQLGGGPRWLLPMLLAGGFIAADSVVKGAFELWPTDNDGGFELIPSDNTKRAAHAALLLGLTGFIEGLVRLPAWCVALGRGIVFGGLAWMLCEGYAPQTISTEDLWGIVAVCGLIGSLIAQSADLGAEKSPGWTGSLVWVIAAGAMQPLFHLAGFSSGSMALAGLMAVLTSTLIVSVIARETRLSRGGVTVIVGLLIAGVLGAGVQSEPKSVPVLLLISGVPLVFAIDAGGAKRTLLVRLLGIAAIAGSSAALLTFGGSAVDEPAESNPYEQYYGG
ncbi:MAG: hypothetical protein AB8F26_04360 [Phycisphaerales bacterium]